MANLTLGKIFSVIFIIIALLLIAQPMIQQVFTSPGGPGANSTVYKNITNIINLYSSPNQTLGVANGSSTSNKSALGKILSLTYSNATASGGGFSAPIISSFTGAAFVFSTIGNIMAVMLTLGAVSSSLMQSLFSFLPSQISLVIVNVLRLFAAFIAFRTLILFISAWSKFDLWQ